MGGVTLDVFGLLGPFFGDGKFFWSVFGAAVVNSVDLGVDRFFLGLFGAMVVFRVGSVVWGERGVVDLG